MAWRFEPGEPLRDAFVRVAEEEIARVRECLQSPTVDRVKAIHEARQGFKRLRALARLAAPALGASFAVENCRWRDAGRLLAGSRDTTVLCQTFDKVMEDFRTAIPARAAQALRARICKEEVAPSAAEIDAKVGQVLDLIADADATVATLAWPDSSATLLRTLRASQKRLRKSWKKARKDDTPDALHAWRKRVKDQSAQLRLFRAVVPDELRALRADAKQTAEYLGEDHDLWMLWQRLSDEPVSTGVVKARDVLMATIAERREVLQRRAFALGKAISSGDPKTFAKKLCDAWNKPAAGGTGKGSKKRGGNKAVSKKGSGTKAASRKPTHRKPAPRKPAAATSRAR